MTVFKITQNPISLQAVQWRGDNEEEVRVFVGDDSCLNFRDEGLRVWNADDFSWIDCPVFHYIVMDEKRNLLPVSEENFRRNYSVE